MRLGWAALAAALAFAGPAAAQWALDPATPSILTWSPEQQQRWYPAIESVYRVSTVRRGDTVRPLPKAAREIAPTLTIGGRTLSVDDYMREHRISGLLVLKDGQIVLERYGLGRGPQDRWTSFSVAKSITSLLAGAAIQDGRLRLEDRVETFVPELKGSGYEGVTLRQLLMMSSGVKWDETYTDPNSDIARFARAGVSGEDPLTGYLAKLPRERAPGSAFHYNTAETNLAGLVVSRAVGKPLAQYLSEKIWAPYGMERDAIWMLDRQGREVAGCCLSMTLRDYGRVGQFALDGGTVDGRPVVPPGWIAESTKVQIANEQPAPAGYGYFWWIGAEGYEASGIFGQSILVFPKERIVFVQNSAWPHPDADHQWQVLQAFQGAVRQAAAPAAPAR